MVWLWRISAVDGVDDDARSAVLCSQLMMLCLGAWLQFHSK
jgi:hypothetical protein